MSRVSFRSRCESLSNAHILTFPELITQVNEENALQKSIIIMQQNSAHFEEGVVRSVQSAWQTFDEWQSRMSTQIQETWKTMSLSMASLPADREWISFSARSDHLIDPDTPLRNPETIEYPCKEDPTVIPVHTGLLERKKRFTRSYRESYYVLTAAGYLHEFLSSDPKNSLNPTFSLFLPACTLGPPSSAAKDKSHKFHIEGRKDGTGTIRGGSILGRREHAYTFRARNRDDMMEWWNDIRMLVARYLVASEQMERSGPIAAAVRSAGYLSEEEGEDEGSSFEEEAGGDEYHNALDAAPRASVDETVPPYSGYGDAETGPNGYLVSVNPLIMLNDVDMQSRLIRKWNVTMKNQTSMLMRQIMAGYPDVLLNDNKRKHQRDVLRMDTTLQPKLKVVQDVQRASSERRASDNCFFLLWLCILRIM